MKLHVLITALGLAAGAAFAQAPAGGTYQQQEGKPGADATQQAPTQATQDSGTLRMHAAKGRTHAAQAGDHASKASRHATKSGKHAAKARRHAARSTRHAGKDGAQHARRMGAAAASPVTDLDAGARQRRMDEAYAAWRNRQ